MLELNSYNKLVARIQTRKWSKKQLSASKIKVTENIWKK
jgi:hypothetical protein